MFPIISYYISSTIFLFVIIQSFKSLFFQIIVEVQKVSKAFREREKKNKRKEKENLKAGIISLF